MRANLESVWRQTGQKPPELENLLELPDEMQYVWRCFIELNNARSGTGYGINPISYMEIYCYFKLQNIEPEEWEVQTIKRLDSIAMKVYADKAEAEQKKASKK